MKKLLLILIVGISSVLAFGADKFMDNATEAFDLAKKENKLVFMVFSGSDWCPPCISLEKNVLSKKDFFKEIGDKYVFVELDFPSKKKLPEKIAKINEFYAKKYKLEGFPTIIVANSDGSVIIQHSGVPNSSLKYFSAWFNRQMELSKKLIKQDKEK